MTDETPELDDAPPFPVDDATLAAIEHALGAYFTFEGEDGEDLDEPRLVGADYTLTTLLDFLGGTAGDDPERCYRIDSEGERMTPEQAARDDAMGVDQVWLDERPHYTEGVLIEALVNEVRRLRALVPPEQREPSTTR